jgi:cation-transporting ATPase 13A1
MIQVSVMAVNYKGRPFMLASTENKPMGWSLLAVCIGVFVCAFEVFPWFNDLLKLVPLPSKEFRNRVCASACPTHKQNQSRLAASRTRSLLG